MSCFSAKTKRSDTAFTLLELLVSLGLIGVLMSMAVGHAMQMHQEYFTDMVRTRINGNLRSAVDIVSMNIRQAGENLPGSFPAVQLTDANGAASDILTLRRSTVPEVLTLCAAVGSGATNLVLSDASSSNAECIAANVTSAYNVFQQRRSSNGNIVRVYLYNWTAQTGEFLDYTNEAISSGDYSMTVSATTDAYPVLTTSIYLLEEYQFQLNTTNNTLDLYVDGDYVNSKTVAFSATGFEIQLEMNVATILSELSTSSVLNWKDIKQIVIAATGQENYKGRSYTSGITSKYFPRNVLSYE